MKDFAMITGWCAAIFMLLCAPSFAHAADSLALTITPPFFQLNVAPGDSWSSAINVVNTNPGNLTVYATVKGFVSSGEEGHGKFLDEAEWKNDRDSLANWLSVSAAPTVIPPGKEAAIPFSLKVPDDAFPGGHYAAILIGTEQPRVASTSGSHVSVSSFISSLIFVRVTGDVVEQGSIKEFSSDRGFYEDPDVNFILRFENSGNTHVKPEGEVEIFNAWGRERGRIAVNQENGFGYVLPSSTRKFEFEWKGEPNFFDFGEYRAVATLAYGENARQSATQTIAFWIVPIWRMVFVVGGTLFFLAVIIFAIRLYVRRAMAIEMARYGKPAEVPRPPEGYRGGFRFKDLGGPISSGVVDLRAAYHASMERVRDPRGMERTNFNWKKYFSLLRKYLWAGILLLLVLCAIMWMILYGKALWSSSGNFEIKVHGAAQSPSSSS